MFNEPLIDWRRQFGGLIQMIKVTKSLRTKIVQEAATEMGDHRIKY